MQTTRRSAAFVSVLGLLAGCPLVTTNDDPCTEGDCSDSRPVVYEIDLPEVRLNGARFSPDASRLAVRHFADDIYSFGVMDVDGSNLDLVLDNVSYLTAFSWTSDGSGLFYSAGSAMHRINVDGTAEETLVSVLGSPTQSDLSPDEDCLVFATNGGSIYLYHIEEDELVDTGQVGQSPRFSPDGLTIAYVWGVFRDYVIRLMDYDGTNVRDILVDEENLSYLTSVAWLPDGERLAFTSRQGIEILDIVTEERRIVEDGFATMSIDVSKEGRHLVYAINGRSHLTVIEGF